MPAVAAAPFIFTGCVEVRQALQRVAIDERELMDRLEEVPAGSIFYHTHGYFLRHRPITTAYGNDFAAWVAVQVRDQALSERLAVVNPFEFPSLEALREELVASSAGPPRPSRSSAKGSRPSTRAPSISTWWRRAPASGAARAISRSGSASRSACPSWRNASSAWTRT
jgi:hypothetical protein